MAVNLSNNAATFAVWAPEKARMMLHLASYPDGLADGRLIAMEKNVTGYFFCTVDGIQAGHRYYYRPENHRDHPDPASHYQPLGIEGPSEIVDHGNYIWKDAGWKGIPLSEMIFYEVHVGTFTPEGSLSAIIPRLGEIAALGINALELMPVAQFPGGRNWGYDGTFPYAVQNNYGGPDGLKQLVDACHREGIAVFLDVVYNHVGYEGNHLSFFGPYFSDKYQTPWGKAFNFDGAWSDGVREFIIGNVLHWAEHYHIDGLRLDAVHEIFDRNAVRVWDELGSAIDEWQLRSGRRLYLVAESDLNSPRVVAPAKGGGLGFDAQWLDDFHHALYVLLDEDGINHYRDYGRLEQFAKAYTEGFVHSGEWVEFRHRRHGASSAGLAGHQFVVFNQNHDLPGNRPGGQRLSVLVDQDKLKLAAAALLLSPYLPLLFMGEEYAEDAPFYFFSDHADLRLREELRKGRKKEFETFQWGGDPPDPQNEQLFFQSKLGWQKRKEGRYADMLEWHRMLIGLRKKHPLLKDLSRERIRTDMAGPSGLAVHRHSRDGRQQTVCLFNFSAAPLFYSLPYAGEGVWTCLLSSSDRLPAYLSRGTSILLPGWGVAVYDLGDTKSNTLRPCTDI